MFSGHGFEFGLYGIGPGQQVVDLGIWMPVDDPGEDVREIGERLDIIELGGLCRPANYAERFRWFGQSRARSGPFRPGTGR